MDARGGLMICWHRWGVKDSEVLPSFIEQAAAGGATIKSTTGGKAASHKPCLVTYRCAKCGAEKVRRG